MALVRRHDQQQERADGLPKTAEVHHPVRSHVSRRWLGGLIAAWLAAAPPVGGQQKPAPGVQKTLRAPDVLDQPTPLVAVRAMLDLAKVGPGDVVYDLGSGDGRIVITAARERGARGVGIDIDPVSIWLSTAQAKESGVTGRVEFRHEDLFEARIDDATVVTLYLLPALNVKLRPKLLADLKPGTRIVSYTWDMGDWLPERVVDVNGYKVYLWTVPPKP
jgi:SAM-dependent methyltransferase